MQATVLALLLAHTIAQVPPFGLLQGIRPLSLPTYSLRHCSYVASFCLTEESNEDFEFSLVPALNGHPNAFSFQSLGFPTMYLGIKNVTSGAVGILQPPDEGSPSDVSWLLQTPLAPPPPGTPSVFSLNSLSDKAQWNSKFLTFVDQQSAPCQYPKPSGDAVLTNGADTDRSTFLIGPAPPQPRVNISISGAISNTQISKRVMGCHHVRLVVPRDLPFSPQLSL
jgi:hypothetical protein